MNFKFSGDIAKTLNRLCREEMKEKLLQDILRDMMVCKIEGYNHEEYLNELKELLNTLTS